MVLYESGKGKRTKRKGTFSEPFYSFEHSEKNRKTKTSDVQNGRNEKRFEFFWEICEKSLDNGKKT